MRLQCPNCNYVGDVKLPPTRKTKRNPKMVAKKQFYNARKIAWYKYFSNTTPNILYIYYYLLEPNSYTDTVSGAKRFDPYRASATQLK